MITCEVCVEGLSGALAAAEGGAHRVELCAGLVEGGTTPSLGTLGLVLDRVEIDTVVLVRPRGGDFLYSPVELDTILLDVGTVRSSGAFGIATGVLTAEGKVDVVAMERILEVAGPLSVTFHRAFDMVRDPAEALETLVGLGVDRILTSGQDRSVPEGQGLIREMAQLAGQRISIMPGGGLREGNVREIVQATGVREVHFTAFTHWDSPMAHRNLRPLMGADRVPGEFERISTDPEGVRRVIGALADLD
jgi:copper homeostasis protein